MCSDLVLVGKGQKNTVLRDEFRLLAFPVIQHHHIRIRPQTNPVTNIKGSKQTK